MQRKLIFLAWLCSCANCFAQQYPFVYYTPKDGLVNSRVRSIKQDSKGRMYFLTYGGLSVYDGTRFTNYTSADGLGNDVINDILEITADSFFVATNTSKLNVLVNSKLSSFKTSDNFYPTVNHFHKSADGNLYVAADEGLFILTKELFLPLPTIVKGTNVAHYIEKIVEYKDYLLLIPWSKEKNEKLIVFHKKERRVTDVFTKEKIHAIAIDRKNRVWVSLNNRMQVLDTNLLNNGKVALTEMPVSFRRLLKHNHENFFFDAEGNSWFFSADNIQKISADNQVQGFSHEQGLHAGNFTGIFYDREGIIWICSAGNGIIKIRNTDTHIIDKSLNGMPVNITAVRNQNDTVWLYNNLENSVIRVFKDEITSFPLKEKMICFDIYIIGQKIYLTNGKKLIAIENKDKAAAYLSPISVIDAPHLSLGSGITDNFGSLLISTTKSDTAHFLSVIKNEKIISEHPISHPTDQLAIDNNQQLWITPRTPQLIVYTLQPDKPGKYLEIIHDYSKQIPAFGSRSIAIDKDNAVWIGTRHNGLYRLAFKNGQKVSLTQFTTKNGLTDNFIYTLTCDNNNNIWAGTQSGLDKIFFRNGRYNIANISRNNNLFQIIYRIAVTNNNTVWGLTNFGGILKILPSQKELTVSPPPLLFTKIKVNDSDWNRQANRLTYRQNNLSFSVSAPSFIDERSIRYSYQLAGSGNTKWSDPANVSDFNFLNLSPGAYTLNVTAEFPESAYPPQTAAYSFIILPPWWQTWWFRILLAAAIALIVTIALRFYYHRKLEKQKLVLEKKQAIEKERTRIATDMHDDLGAGLSRIKFLSETIGIKKQQQLPIEEDISKIREYSHEMIGKMGEIVWALNEKNDSLKDLLSYTRAYAVEYLSQNGIQCEVVMHDDFKNRFVSGEFRRNIFLSVKEALHNIVKHAQASSVTISIKNDEELEIIIHDNGIGFDINDIRPFSNGLSNMQKRMEDIGGSNEIQNGMGTIVKLKAPL